MTLDSDPAFKVDCLEFPDASLKEVVLLGLIAEEPSHAYGLEEKIRARRMTEWTNISISSIYRVLSGLQEKGLIDTTLEHEGQGATRKVHSINDAGRQLLARGVAHHITYAKPVKNPLSVSLAFLTHAPYDTVVEKLAERAAMIETVGEEMRRVKALAAGFVEQTLSERGQVDTKGAEALRLRTSLLFDNILYHIDAEQRFIADARERVQKTAADVFFNEASTADAPSAPPAETDKKKVQR